MTNLKSKIILGATILGLASWGISKVDFKTEEERHLKKVQEIDSAYFAKRDSVIFDYLGEYAKKEDFRTIWKTEVLPMLDSLKIEYEKRRDEMRY